MIKRCPVKKKNRLIEVSAVTFFPLPISPKGMIGFSAMTLNDCIALNGIAVYTKPDGSGYRAVFPKKVLAHGAEISLFHPTNSEAAAIITEAIEQKINEIRGRQNCNHS
jgi:DNA-binding cell septation regulator SpoVG